MLKRCVAGLLLTAAFAAPSFADVNFSFGVEIALVL